MTSITEITQHPLSMIYNIGEEFLFTCSASDADLLHFLVNGTPADDETIVNQGYTQSGVDINGDISMRNLTGIAQIQHNGTNIICAAVKLSPLEVAISNVAVYQVQGNNNSITSSMIILVLLAIIIILSYRSIIISWWFILFFH